MASTDEKKAKADARKAKLLSKGGDRLARITGQGRPGEDHDDASTTTTPSLPTSLNSPPPATTANEDPEEIDLSAKPNPRSTRAFADSLTGSATPDFLSLFGQDGDSSNMPGFNFPFPPPENHSSSLQPLRRSKIQVLYTLLHFLFISVLAVYAVVVLEPLSVLVEDAEAAGWRTSLTRWGKLRWTESDIGTGGIGIVPLFTTFVTMEIFLQTINIMFIPIRPPAPSMLNTVLAYLPPSIKVYIDTGRKYWEIFSNLLDDLSVLVFVVGLCIMIGSWDREYGELKLS